MAVPGKPLDSATRSTILRLRKSGFSYRRTARLAGVCLRTVQKYVKKTRK